MAFDIVTLLNFILNLAIIVVGFLAYMKNRNFVPLYIAMAFVLFSITHLLTLLNLSEQMLYPIIVLRLIGYLMIVFTLYKILVQPNEKKK